MDIICVTNRKLCKSPTEAGFLCRIEKIAASRHKPKYIVLREKDLTEAEYLCLALKVNEICAKYSLPLICNSFYRAAKEVGAAGAHLPLSLAENGTGYCRSNGLIAGVSVHSRGEAVKAEAMGADYITYGHIFPTNCKKGLPPRGLDALKEVCASVHIPVYAIGGVTPENAPLTAQAGARGVCLMSSLMQTDKPEELTEKFI